MSVIPAEAGIHSYSIQYWIPASAGMTNIVRNYKKKNPKTKNGNGVS